MKNILLLSTVLLALSLISCSKEDSFEDPTRVPGTIDSTGGGTGSGGNNSNGTQLYRVGTRLGTDSVTTNYTYNSNGTLLRFAQAGTFNSIPITAEGRYVRNATNIITQSIVKSSVLVAQFGLDSVIAQVYYDAANSRYTHRVARVNQGGGIIATDSSVLVYTAGKLSGVINYYDDGSGNGYEPDSKEEYTYTGANLLQTKSFTYDAGANIWELETTSTSEYDTKTNPISFPVDAPVMDMALFFSANNETKRTRADAASGQTDVLTNLYTYTSSNKPATAISSTNGVVSSQSTYYYR